MIRSHARAGLGRTWRLAIVAAALAVATAVPAMATPTSPPVLTNVPRDDRPTSPAWIVIEGVDGRVIAEHRADELRPVASTIKVLTALTVLETHDLTDRVRIGDEVVSIGGAVVGLRPGDEWTIGELLDGLIARSGNDAAEALAVHVAGSRDAFVARMRDRAEALGMAPIDVHTPTGLDDANRVSARALARAGRAALADPRLRDVVGRATVELPGSGEVASRNTLLTTYPGATGVKTGFTSAAGNTIIASAERDGRELVAVVLGATTEAARFRDAATLLDLGFRLTRRFDHVPAVTTRVGGGRVEWTGDTEGRTIARAAHVDVAVEGNVTEPLHARIRIDGKDADVIELAPQPQSRVELGTGTGEWWGRHAADVAYRAMRHVSIDDGLR